MVLKIRTNVEIKITYIIAFCVLCICNIYIFNNMEWRVLQHTQNPPILQYNRSPKNSYQHGLDSSCVAMFDIGFNKMLTRTSNTKKELKEGLKATDWKRFLEARKSAVLNDDEYKPFSKSIANIVSSTNGKLQILNESRLQIMRGQISYIPCPIKEYDDDRLNRCFELRRESDKSLWLVFYGDSRMRNMFLYFLKRTQNVRAWSIRKNSEKKLKLEELIPLKELESIFANSASGDRIVYVAANHGLKLGESFEPREYLLQLLNGAEKNEKVPNFIITCYGSWEFSLSPEMSIFDKYSNLLLNWNELRKILERLSKYMTIISTYQTRLRHTHTDHRKQRANFTYFMGYYEDVTTEFGESFSDNVMRTFLSNTRMIVWDSTLPLYLAAAEECNELLKNNRSLIMEEDMKSEPFQRFMCHDRLHKSGATLHDEITMLLNLLCNPFLSREESLEYCCS